MKLIEIVASEGNVDTVSAIAEKHKVHHFRSGAEGDAQWMRLLVDDHQIQAVLDTLQGVLGAQPGARILVMPVDVALPRPTEGKETKNPAITAREALYSEVEKNARPDVNFFVLVALSTVVAAIGLIENNVAVVIGAMVIAPLLGPNLALAFGAALGDLPLMRKSLKTTAAGIGLAVGLSVVIGVIWPFDLASPELLSRTDAQLDSVALALASGAAAVLSLTTGLPSVLVGVMVAVALLPPATTLGLMLGRGQADLATGAALLLAVNIVCLNLASKIVFLVRGIRPRTWWEKAQAKRAMTIYLVVWVVTLFVLVLAIYFRQVWAR